MSSARSSRARASCARRRNADSVFKSCSALSQRRCILVPSKSVLGLRCSPRCSCKGIEVGEPTSMARRGIASRASPKQRQTASDEHQHTRPKKKSTPGPPTRRRRRSALVVPCGVLDQVSLQTCLLSPVSLCLPSLSRVSLCLWAAFRRRGMRDVETVFQSTRRAVGHSCRFSGGRRRGLRRSRSCRRSRRA